MDRLSYICLLCFIPMSRLRKKSTYAQAMIHTVLLAVTGCNVVIKQLINATKVKMNTAQCFKTFEYSTACLYNLSLGSTLQTRFSKNYFLCIQKCVKLFWQRLHKQDIANVILSHHGNLHRLYANQSCLTIVRLCCINTSNKSSFIHKIPG